jgi:hypothetical protein
VWQERGRGCGSYLGGDELDASDLAGLLGLDKIKDLRVLLLQAEVLKLGTLRKTKQTRRSSEDK